MLKLVKDTDNFHYEFKMSDFIFILYQKSEDKFELKINNKLFVDLIKEERTGKLDKEREEALKKKNKENKREHQNEDDYYKRAMKYNGDNYVEGDEDFYNVEQQRIMLEEFERKKKEKMKETDKLDNNYNNDNFSNDNKQKNREKKIFILDEKTVNINRMIINSLKLILFILLI